MNLLLKTNKFIATISLKEQIFVKSALDMDKKQYKSEQKTELLIKA